MQRILCLGDSNTYGYDPRSYLGGRYPKSVRWTGLLEREGRELINCGQNGLSIPWEALFPSLRRLLQSRLPLDLITVMLGSNDLLEGASPETAAERMEKLLLCLRRSVPQARLLLIAPPPMEPGDWVSGPAVIDKSRRLIPLYRELAERLALPFADAGQWSVSLSFDGVHFTPEGHAAFARGLNALLDTLL